jgi:hypothetical protein
LLRVGQTASKTVIYPRNLFGLGNAFIIPERCQALALRNWSAEKTSDLIFSKKHQAVFLEPI